ncbi:MAG: DUF3592 domain-containing protein [Bryobacterales bacterium]|nr:DUF3592 domain-containing protein [Bryobacterales bacterium]
MAQAPATSFPGELFAFFGLSCAVAGAAVLLTSYLGQDFLAWWKARQWTVGQCTVVRSDPSLLYRLTVKGMEYDSGRIGIGDWQSVYQLGDPQVGERLACYYNPASPAESVLTRDYAGWWWLPGAWLLAAFMMLSTAPGLLIGLWRWAIHRPDPPLTWAEWLSTFYRNGAWSMSLVGFAALLPGLAMIWFMTVAPWWNWRQAQSWQPTPCEMTRSEVRNWSAGSGRDATGGYVMDIAFRYSFGGKEYGAATFSPWRLGGTEWLLQSTRTEQVEALLQKYAVGTQHTCYVSPLQPWRAYLSRDRSGFGTYVSAIGPFLALVGWVVICSRR